MSLSDIYRSSSKQEIEERVDSLNTRFIEEYNQNGKYLNRSPGRVNLIGEHIDYNGYGVLPFAIEKDCLMISGLNEHSLVRISHRNKSKYQIKEIELESLNDLGNESHLNHEG